MAANDDYQPIALNDLLFCERRCALHRIEGVWRRTRTCSNGRTGISGARRTTVATAPGLRAVDAMLR